MLEREVGRYDETIARGKGLFNDDQLRRIGTVAQLARRPAAHRSLPAHRGRQSDAFDRDPPAADGAQEPWWHPNRPWLPRVARAGGEPIPGLYAVGEAAGFGGGGVHGKRSLEGTFLGGCVFTGRLAAASDRRSELPLRIPPRVA